MAREFGLEIKIELMGLKTQDGDGVDVGLLKDNPHICEV